MLPGKLVKAMCLRVWGGLAEELAGTEEGRGGRGCWTKGWKRPRQSASSAAGEAGCSCRCDEAMRAQVPGRGYGV